MEQIKLSSYVKSVLSEEDLPRFDADDKGEDKGEKKPDTDMVYTITCHDDEGALKKLLEYIKEIGNGGHSFKIVVDPENKETMKEFGWDGDGSDKIESIKAEKKEEEKPKEPAEEKPEGAEGK
jgi:hypothetical protein